jgi:very-short-patch-repair endonuclease
VDARHAHLALCIETPLREQEYRVIGRARALRRTMTEAEIKLCNTLRARRLCGFKFVRQQPIGPYIADFCCRSRRLVVEAEGIQHADNPRD